jgi:hypothetical protein
MKYQDIYASLGLIENPFGILALSPNEKGERLMVGRDDDLHIVGRRLHKHGKITCLDGHVGVGKTSLVNVAAHKCFKAYLSGETPQLLIPSIDSYQLKKDGNVEQFIQEVFQGIAQTLLKNAETLKQQYDLTKEARTLHQLDAWLNSPVVQHLNDNFGVGASIGAPGFAQISINSGATKAGQLNQSAGFAQNGFETLVRQLLDEIFSDQGNGGVVCIIDNIELLETGPVARRMLESLRDKLFNVRGLRWVFCGANGVIHSLASSPRLTAYLSTPLDIANIQPSALPNLIRARLAEFSTNVVKAEEDLPIEIEDLKDLYLLVNSNLRDLLGLADQFCEYCADTKIPKNSQEKQTRFKKWLNKVTVDKYKNLQSRISEKAWAVLDIAMSQQFNGTFGAADYSSFNSNSTESFKNNTFSKWIRDLVKLGLLSKSFDDEQSEDDGFKRDVYSVTANGALVHYARRMNKESYSLLQPIEWIRSVHHDKHNYR